MRAILTGGRYPHALLAAVIMRMRSDRAVNGHARGDLQGLPQSRCPLERTRRRTFP